MTFNCLERKNIRLLKLKGCVWLPKGKVKTTEVLPEPALNIPLQVVKVEETTTQTQGYRGLRIELQDEKGEKYASMLWYQESYSIQTKFGSLCYSFHGELFLKNGEFDTDEWLGKWIRFISWKKGNRLVERISAPKGKTDIKPTLA